MCEYYVTKVMLEQREERFVFVKNNSSFYHALFFISKLIIRIIIYKEHCIFLGCIPFFDSVLSVSDKSIYTLYGGLIFLWHILHP